MKHCYFNGEILPYSQCKLHVSDLQMQRGYGIFDFFRVQGNSVPWMEDYRDRLFTSIRLSGMEEPFSREGFADILERLKKQNGVGPDSGTSAFKVLVTGGYSENLGSVSAPPNVLVLHLPWKPAPEVTLREGIRLISDKFQRPNPEVKSLYYFNSLRLQQRMQSEGALEVLYHNKLVTECSRCSVFFVKEGEVFSTAKNILDGITRKQLMRQFPEISTRDIGLEEVFAVDEMFLTSTSRAITPVVALDGRPIGKGRPGPFTQELQRAFRV